MSRESVNASGKTKVSSGRDLLLPASAGLPFAAWKSAVSSASCSAFLSVSATISQTGAGWRRSSSASTAPRAGGHTPVCLARGGRTRALSEALSTGGREGEGTPTNEKGNDGRDRAAISGGRLA
jgi:hypothetical protein